MWCGTVWRRLGRGECRVGRCVSSAGVDGIESLTVPRMGVPLAGLRQAEVEDDGRGPWWDDSVLGLQRQELSSKGGCQEKPGAGLS